MKVFVEPMGFEPIRAHKTDAGLDLRAIVDKEIPARGSEVFRTGVHIELPPNTYGKLESKSGLNVAHNVVCCGGTIDEPYRGEILVKLYNLGDEPYYVCRGDKICQLIVQPCLYEDVELIEELDTNTSRGTNGFGSTGK